MSRNQREGHYYGWSKGRHIRTHEFRRVDSWRAFRVRMDRAYCELARNRAATREAEALGDKGESHADQA